MVMKLRVGLLSILFCFVISLSALGMDFESFLQEASKTGITIERTDEYVAWTGPYGGKIKPNGPLAGKKIGLVVGCDFSDWQAY